MTDITTRTTVCAFPDTESLARSVTQRTVEALTTGLSERGRGVFAVPGGRTPATFLSHLAHASLPWENIVVTLTDERWVETNSPDSNEVMVRRHLLVGPAAKINLLPLYNGAPTPEAGLDDVDRNLSAYSDPFDLVILGMGDDGHIASLFPGEDTWPHTPASKQCVAAKGPFGGPPRLSLTLERLLHTHALIVLATGDKKRHIWDDAEKKGSAASLPIGALMDTATCPLALYWCP